MPSYVENRLTVCGPTNLISEIVQATGLEHGEFDFNGIVPMPKELDVDSSFRVGDWGAKWTPSRVSVHALEPDYFVVYFSTAWSPPVPFVEALCLDSAALAVDLAYADEECAFAGTVTGRDGCVSYEHAAEVKEFCEEEFGLLPLGSNNDNGVDA